MPSIGRLLFCLVPLLAAMPVAVNAQPVGRVELLHAFHAAPGNPAGGLARAADGSFYGLTARLLYRLATDGTLTVAHTFAPASSGAGAPTVAPDGVVYGVVTLADRVAVFRFDPATSAFRILRNFDTARDGSTTRQDHGSTSRTMVGSLVIGPDGWLYGTTTGNLLGLPPNFHGTVYRVHPVTGDGATLHEFSGSAPALRHPVGGLVEVGGQLYGAARFGGIVGPVPAQLGHGGIYRLDPTTGTVTTVHLFSGPTGRNPEVGLTRTSDGLLYGTAFPNLPAGSSTSLTHVFRFNPPGGALEVVLAESGVTPSQLVEAGDGHLYGVTEANPRIFRVRRQPGGGHSLETVRDHGIDDGTATSREPFAIGLDGFLHGTALIEGPHRAGTAFKFDPLQGGGSGNPSQFAIVHPFYQNSHNWLPSVPVRAPNGDLYGTTSRGGITLRGAVYRIDGTTGAVSIVGPMPGDPHPGFATVIANSDLVVGPDGLLYGTSSVDDHRIVRVNPASGAITTAAMASSPFGGLTRGPDGGLYLSGIHGFNGVSVSRFDSATNAVVTIATRGTSRGALGASRPVLGADNQLYLTIGYFEPLGGAFQSTVELVRLDVASGAFVTVAGPASFPAQPFAVSVPARLVTPIAAANGSILVPVRVPSGAFSLFEVSPATGAVRVACADFGRLAAFGPDGASYSVDGRLRRCDPATGVSVQQSLVPAVGTAREEPAVLTAVVHGATSGGLYGGGTLFRLNPTGLPALDTDGDGLSNAWESTFGLDPFRTDFADGAAADPDGDGRTNAQEAAAGTHPRGFLTRYFAEGATGPFFRTRIEISNPNSGLAAIVLLRFLTEAGAPVTREVVVAASAHVSVDAATIPGLAHASFSIIAESDQTIAVDRTMAWDATGYGSDTEAGVVAPSTTWHFAEGSTSGEFALFYLLQNPEPVAVTATVRYLRPAGQAPVVKTYTLPAHSRTTIVVDAEGPELASTDVSAVVTATAPIVAERAMYFSRPGQPFAAGHESAGVTAPALEWFFAEGATGSFFDLFVLSSNPGPTDAAVDVEYLLSGGGTLTKSYVVPASSRVTIWVDDEQLPAGSGQRPLAAATLSMRVRSTNAVPIVAERTMWWPGPAVTSNFWYEAHNATGATATALRWATGGGESDGPAGGQTYVLIANPSAIAGRARVTVLAENGIASTGEHDLPARSRTTLVFVFGGGPIVSRFGVLVESLGPTSVPIVVERATYANPGGVLWSSGSAALASPLP